MALLDDDSFLSFVKAYAADEKLFFADFADAFSKLISKGCPAHVQPDAVPQYTEEASNIDKTFRDLAMHGSVERMEEVARNAEVNVNSIEALSGRTALHKAAFFGHANVVTYLLEKGANVDITDVDGDSALHDAARYGHVAVVEALLKAGAHLALTNNDGKTANFLARANFKEIDGLGHNPA